MEIAYFYSLNFFFRGMFRRLLSESSFVLHNILDIRVFLKNTYYFSKINKLSINFYIKKETRSAENCCIVIYKILMEEKYGKFSLVSASLIF